MDAGAATLPVMRFALFMPFTYLAGIDGFAMFAAYAGFVGLVAMTFRFVARRRSVGQSSSRRQAVTDLAESTPHPAAVVWT
jgi:hypothetical protein